jgi:3-hydroxyisobutyrate dehydrogenase-like beta-hydroxyacid dehydrogenase
MEAFEQTEISIVGLGAMGSALAKVLLQGGRRASVWNRTRGKAETFAASGAILAADPAEAFAASPVAVISLANMDAVREVLAVAEARLSGRTIVNTTNGTPEDVRRLSNWVVERGGCYLHGGIMAVPPLIGSAQAHILFSGSSDAFEKSRPILELFGAATFLGQDSGRAPLFEFALLSIMYGLYGGFLHGAALLAADDLPVDAFAKLASSWGAGLSQWLPRLAQQIDTRSYSQNVVSSLAMQREGIDMFATWSKTHRIGGDLLQPMQQLMSRRIADGYGNDGIASLFELVRPAPI